MFETLLIDRVSWPSSWRCALRHRREDILDGRSVFALPGAALGAMNGDVRRVSADGTGFGKRTTVQEES